jgi:glycogen operon protein
MRRNLLGTLLLSAGVPMILGGDEIGRTQDGNNNAYCQDSELSWYDWENVDLDLLAFTKAALALRRDHEALRPREYLRGPEGGPAQMVLYRPDGGQMSAEDWSNPIAKTLAVALHGRQIEDAEGDTRRDRLLLLINAHHEPVEFTIPAGSGSWNVVLTTYDPDPIEVLEAGGSVAVRDRALLLLHSR